jgi:hypothetical protein
MIVKDYLQIEKRDFDETYASVVRSNTSCMMLVIALVLDYQIRQFDIKTTFLYDQMNRMIYTDQSKNFEKRNTNSLKACLLNTSLYDLMQTSYLWFDEIKKTLITYDLAQSKHDEALFFKKELYVSLYVNDIKIFASDAQSLDHFS